MIFRPKRVLVFTGEGKGKTTAALGMLLRAAGHDLPCALFQFVKTDTGSGEIHSLVRLGVEVHVTGRGFLPPGGDALVEHRLAAEAGLRQAAVLLAAGDHRLVVLDEVCYAVARGLLQEEVVADAVRNAAPGVCVVLTGRWATRGLTELADTATDMRCIKHGYQQGIPAQEGVEC